jgi:hypothetical protein
MLHLKYLITACVLALVINVGGADAAGRGSGGWHGGGSGWHGVGYRGRYYGGGYFATPYYDYFATPYYDIERVGDVPALQPLGPAIPATFALSCHRSQEIKTVPSEDGGDRQIKITRC